MPLPAPPLDARRYDDLVADLVARIPVHTPEWTNLGDGDPGITLVQLFAHLTESLLYRTNQIPERNRARFVSLLGGGLQPARPAEGLAEIRNEAGPLSARPIAADLELSAGSIPFRTLDAVDALPLEAQCFVKRPVAEPAAGVADYYELLYAAYGLPPANPLQLYETVPCDWALGAVDVAATTDRAIWVGLFAREADVGEGDDPLGAVRNALGGRILSLGLVPSAELTERVLPAGRASQQQPADDLLRFELPLVEGRLATAGAGQLPTPRYRSLVTRRDFDPLNEMGVVELTLPPAPQIDSWRDLDPLEAGVGALPPALEDPALAARLVTWLRISAPGAAAARFRWAGINAARIRQQQVVRSERLLPDGDGSPGQVRVLANAPVIAESATITSIESGTSRSWSRIDDLISAGPEVRLAGAPGPERPVDVFALDAESGSVSFGDGLAGRRLAAGARAYASYAFCLGSAGNLAAGSIKGGPLLDAGYAAANPVATTGGADAENAADGERQVRRFLQHRDRLVTAADFEAVTWRTPGIEVGRVEVLPAWRPELSPAGPGSAPGAVTVIAIPRSDPAHPQAPRANRDFLDAICRYLDPRRLVTTELVVRGPVWKGVWISVGIEVSGGHGVAETVEAVRARLVAALSPLPPAGVGPAELLSQPFGPTPDPARRGWPLNQSVRSVVLMAEVARVSGVLAVVDVLLAEGSRGQSEEIGMAGIELPEILGISVVAGDPVPIDALRGTGPETPSQPPLLPVPFIPETC